MRWNHTILLCSVSFCFRNFIPSAHRKLPTENDTRVKHDFRFDTFFHVNPFFLFLLRLFFTSGAKSQFFSLFVGLAWFMCTARIYRRTKGLLMIVDTFALSSFPWVCASVCVFVRLFRAGQRDADLGWHVRCWQCRVFEFWLKRMIKFQAASTERQRIYDPSSIVADLLAMKMLGRGHKSNRIVFR